MRTIIACLMAALVCVTSGCGTVANLLSERPEPYGGVVRSLTFGSALLPQNVDTDARTFAFLLGCWGAEILASGVGDTMCWLFLHPPGAEEKTSEEPALRPQYSAGAAMKPEEFDKGCERAELLPLFLPRAP